MEKWSNKLEASHGYCCSVAQSCLTFRDPMDSSKSGFPVPYHLPEFAHVHVYPISDAIQPSHPLTPSSPSIVIFSSIRVFSVEPAISIRWPKYWSFSCSISPSSEYLGLIFFRIDQLDFFAVQGTLKSLLQNHSSKAWILWCSAEVSSQERSP